MHATLAGKPHELVLLDWTMPDVEGIECRRLLLDHGAEAIVPMVSALAREELLAMLARERISVAAVLSKPVTHEALRMVCSSTVGDAAASPSPVEPAHAFEPADAATPAPELEFGLQGVKVLVVEDNELNQELVVALLVEAGMNVLVANNGRDAIALLDTERFDVVLMDCQMPGMDGYVTTVEIRRDPRWSTLPIIAMTANAMAGDRDRALASGMNDHIVKPLDIPGMFATLQRWCRSESPAVT
jgi:CheY-like chemotaxis protein